MLNSHRAKTCTDSFTLTSAQIQNCVLGLSALGTQSTKSEIKKAYRTLASKLHPDKNSAPHANEAFKAVGLAYATVSDPVKRCQYNLTGDEDPVKVVAWQQDEKEDGKKGSASYLGELYYL